MNNRVKSLIAFFILLAIILIVLKRKENITEFIISDYSLTEGRIIRAYVLGGAEVWMDYEYIVDSVKYKNTFTPESFTYYDCYKDFQLCDTLVFWIMYSNKESDKSMIDLSAPIQTGENPKMTRNIHDFE